MTLRTITRAIVSCIFCTIPAAADPLGTRIYDGDTIAPTIRLTIDAEISFDTPETSRRSGAQCDLEIERGKAASARLREIIRKADVFRLEPLYDFNTGEIARTRDRRRLLARAIADGTNVGHTLAAEGHAMIYNWRTQRIDWCASPPKREAR